MSGRAICANAMAGGDICEMTRNKSDCSQILEDLIGNSRYSLVGIFYFKIIIKIV